MKCRHQWEKVQSSADGKFVSEYPVSVHRCVKCAAERAVERYSLYGGYHRNIFLRLPGWRNWRAHYYSL